MSTTTVRRLAALAAAILVTLASLAGVPARAAEASVLRIAIVAQIDTLNPFKTALLSSINVNRMQFESLVESGLQNEPVGGFADRWETSPDGRTWTFTVPDGRVWSDGQPATADDAAWTLNQIMTKPELATANGTLVANVASAVARDPRTLVITTKAPQAANPGIDIPIVPRHVWENRDAAHYLDDVTEPVVGSGPFVVTKLDKGQSLELAANPRFWRGAPRAAGLRWVWYKNMDAAVQGLRTGEIDLVSGLTNAQFDALSGVPGVTTSAGAGRRYIGLTANPGMASSANQPMGNGNPALRDPAVRRAVFLAIDNATIVERVLGGRAKPGVTQIPTVYPAYFGLPAGASPRTFDPDEAGRLLDAAGYRRGADGVRVDKASGRPLTLRLLGRNSSPDLARIGEYVRSWLERVGVRTTVQIVSDAKTDQDSAVGNYDLLLTGWAVGPDPDFQLSINRCSSRPNTDGSGRLSEVGFCDAEFDRLFAAQHAELDEAHRADLVKRAFGRLYDANVLDVLYYPDQLEAYRSDRWNDFQRQPTGTGPITGQNSYWGLYSATPRDAAGAEGTPGASAAPGAGPASDAVSGASIAGILVTVALAGGAIYLVRRRRSADERE